MPKHLKTLQAILPAFWKRVPLVSIFEDQVVGTNDLYSVADQTNRIHAARKAAEAAGIDLFINARTDLFLKSGPEGDHAALIAPALERAKAYADAGASGFFAPMLADPDLIATLADASPTAAEHHDDAACSINQRT